MKFGGVYVDDLIFGLQYVFDVLPRHCRETSLHFGQNRSRGETNFLRTSCQVKIVPCSLLRTYINIFRDCNIPLINYKFSSQVLSRGQVLPTKDHSEDQVRSDANPAASSQILNYIPATTHTITLPTNHLTKPYRRLANWKIENDQTCPRLKMTLRRPPPKPSAS